MWLGQSEQGGDHSSWGSARMVRADVGGLIRIVRPSGLALMAPSGRCVWPHGFLQSIEQKECWTSDA